MRIIYAPDGEEPREFLFKPWELFSFDSEAIEEVGDRVWSNWNGFIDALGAGKGRALRAALWIELRKEKPTLTFPAVIVRPGEIVGLPDDEEIADARAVAADPDTPDGVREQIWAALGKGDEAEASDNSDSPTGSESPTPDSET